jgi:hypothetical protein
MQFEGDDLCRILNGQAETVEVYGSDGFLRGDLPAAITARMTLSAYVGVGNRRRIRYIRPLDGAKTTPREVMQELRNGSRTTVRLTGPGNCLLGGQWLREHRRIGSN